MLTAPTTEKLQALKLAAMAAALTAQQRDAALSQLSFDERFGLLVEAEWLARENKRLARALQEAKLKLSQACREAIDYPAARELDRALLRQLASCRWVAEHQNVLITGATGVGKSFLACALAHQACRQGYRALYRRASRLFPELTLARADGTYVRLLGKFARPSAPPPRWPTSPPRTPPSKGSPRSTGPSAGLSSEALPPGPSRFHRILRRQIVRFFSGGMTIGQPAARPPEASGPEGRGGPERP
jgi:hypothetical protein